MQLQTTILLEHTDGKKLLDMFADSMEQAKYPQTQQRDCLNVAKNELHQLMTIAFDHGRAFEKTQK